SRSGRCVSLNTSVGSDVLLHLLSCFLSLSACSSYKSCDQCAPNTKCLWCFTTNNCTDYPVSWLLPPPSLCQLSQARWGVCWLNFEGLIIALAVVGGAVLVSIVDLCIYLLIKEKPLNTHMQDTFLMRHKHRPGLQEDTDKNVERKARHDQIRKKYGLMSDSDHPYSKFEN
uniref:PTTG1 interacting protein n=1 Tax=Gasterosteus aculeatus TaxID=69293 RepID=G3PMC5_GASAC